MNYKEGIEQILGEIRRCLSQVEEEEIYDAARTIISAKRVFVEGVGRSGLVAATFAMRLSQMGIITYVVAETTTPSIQKDDLLIICSGSGESDSLITHAQTAKKLQALVMLYTANASSEIGCSSDYQIVISAPKKYEIETASMQPMGTLFEQSVTIAFDITILELMKQMNLSSKQMYKNHKNLE